MEERKVFAVFGGGVVTDGGRQCCRPNIHNPLIALFNDRSLSHDHISVTVHLCFYLTNVLMEFVVCYVTYQRFCFIRMSQCRECKY